MPKITTNNEVKNEVLDQLFLMDKISEVEIKMLLLVITKQLDEIIRLLKEGGLS